MKILSLNDTLKISGGSIYLTYELVNWMNILEFTITNQNDVFNCGPLSFINDRFYYDNNAYFSSTSYISDSYNFNVEMTAQADGSMHYYAVTPF